MKQGTQSQCSGTTRRDGVGRETGGGFRMGDTCTCGWLMLMYGKEITILQSNYPPIKMNKLYKKKRHGRHEGREKRCLSKGRRRRRQGCGACGLDCAPCCWGQLTPIRSTPCQEGLHTGYQVGIKWKYLDTWLWPFTRGDLDQWGPAGLQMMILRVLGSRWWSWECEPVIRHHWYTRSLSYHQRFVIQVC